MGAAQSTGPRRNLSDYVRVQLALMAKPLIRKQAKTRQRGGQGGILLGPKSDETKSACADEAVAALADISCATVRKVEKIEEQGSAELREAVLAGGLSISLANLDHPAQS